ncbi:MAG: tetratricopeptide repeat protein [Alphaproteobacteria bacterium]|nr:tetratricopeptide repeat protein [Alphaproteobacteria bacterium]
MSDSRDPRNHSEILPMLPVPDNQKEPQDVGDDFIDIELDDDPASGKGQASQGTADDEDFSSKDHYGDEYGSFDDITDSQSEEPDSYDFKNQNTDLNNIDEEGIFADPNQEKPQKKSGSSLGIALLVIIIIFGGFVGYSYYSAPQIFKQFPDNFSINELMRSFGIGAADEVGISFKESNTAKMSEPKMQTGVVESSDSSKDTKDTKELTKNTPTQSVQSSDLPPQPKPIAAETPQELAVSKPDNSQDKNSQDANSQDGGAVVKDVKRDLAGGVNAEAKNQIVAPSKDQKLVQETNTKIFHPETQGVDITKIIDDLGNDTDKNSKNNAEKNTSTSSTELAGRGDSKDLKDSQNAADTNSTPSRTSPFDELEKDEEENKIYDSPPGDLFAKMPAPSLNPQRGDNNSIIVVQKAGEAKAQKNYSDAEKVSIEATNLDRQLVAGSRAVKLGMYDAAAKIYDDLYRKNPRDIGTLMGRAILFQKTGERARAIESYEVVLELAPGNTEAIINLAGLIRKEQPAVALEKLLNLREKYPNNVAIAAQLGVTYADAGNLVDAYKYIDLAASLEPRNPLHYFNQAVVADRAGDREKAIRLYEKALEVDAIYGSGRTIPRDQIYDRLSNLRS